MNIKRNVKCEEPCISTLQRFPIIRALKKFFLLVENLSFVYVNQLLPLLCYRNCLLDEQKIARTFLNGVPNFAGMENYIMVKQSG